VSTELAPPGEPPRAAPASAPVEKRLSPLDGIRAIAILIVLAFHTTADSRFPVPKLGVLATPVLHGWIGVDLFFGMSGFLITRMWLEEEALAPEESWTSRAKRFYARRSLRILPLYYVTFFGFLLLAHVLPLRTLATYAARVGADPAAIVPYVLFFMNYASFGRDGTFAARWSLCVEEHFYLLWPWLLILVKKARARLSIALVVCLALLALRTFALAWGNHKTGWTSNMMVRYSSHLRMDSILWGGVAALSYDWLVSAAWARRAMLAACGVAVAVMIWTDLILVVRAPTIVGGGLGGTVIAAGAALLSAEVTAAPRSWLARGLSLPPLPFVGYHSYALYLVHPVAIELMTPLAFPPAGTDPTIWHWVLDVVLTTAASLLVAVALDATLERPFRALRGRLRLRRAPA
jgi:peptidoglycan/LPS O-acetylase OafA/YrhL